MSIGEIGAPSSPPSAAPAIEVVEGGPSPTDTNGVEALGGSSMKFGSLLSITGGAAAKGVAWTGCSGAGGEGGVGVWSAGGEEGAALVLLVTGHPQSLHNPLLPLAPLEEPSSWVSSRPVSSFVGRVVPQKKLDLEEESFLEQRRSPPPSYARFGSPPRACEIGRSTSVLPVFLSPACYLHRVKGR